MTMSNPHSGTRYWCCKCDREINWFDDKRCRICDPVERINALAELLVFEEYFENVERMDAFIEACEIILEADND